MAQMHSLESGFKKAKQATAERRRRRRLRRWFGWLAAVAVAVIVAGIGLNYSLLLSLFTRPAEPVVVEEAIDETPDVYIPAIVDLAGDPMRISIGETAGIQLTRFVPRPGRGSGRAGERRDRCA